MEELTRIAVLVSGGGTNLQALIDAQGTVITHGKIELVVSNVSKAYALTRAEKAGIPSRVITRKQEGSAGAFEKKLIDTLEEFDIDFIILAGFMSILSEDFVKRFDHRIINVHPALIPSFCGKGMYGLLVHEAALAKGVKVTGATVHYVNEVPDGGEIILQKAVSIRKNDTPETLQRRVMEQAEWKLLPRAAEIVSKKIMAEKQTKGVNR